MKKYYLKFGEDVPCFHKNKFGNVMFYGVCFHGEKYLYYETDTLYSFCQKGSVLYKREKIAFTQDEIDNLPHGIMKYAELVEIKEDKYNIICPYTGEYFTELITEGGNKWWISESGDDNWVVKKQFTMQEIKEKYPDLEKWAKKYEKC